MTSASPPSSAIPRALLIAAAVYVLAWSLVPPLLAPSFPLDVVESLGWGREWQWGYYKHPPLPPIALHVAYVAFGRFGPFILSQICIIGTLWMVWLTARRLVTRERALLATVLTMGVVFYTRPALEFNHNVAQMPFWAGIAYAYLAAWQDGKRRQWVLLGMLAGLGLLSKYSIGVLLLCLGLFTLLTPARSLLRGPGPWVAIGVMLLVFAPHLVWLHQNDWLPFVYARGRASTATGTPSRLGALTFALTQLLNHLPLLLVVLFAWARPALRKQLPPADSRWQLHCSQPRYLLVIALAPAALLIVLSALFGIRLKDMWGVPIWPFSGLLVAALLPTTWLAAMRPYLLRGIGVWLVFISLLAGSYLVYVHDWRKRPVRSDWPAAAVAVQANQTWAQLSTCPLDMVAGDAWTAGVIAIHSHSQPSVLLYGDPRFSPWATPERAQTHGALWVWQPQDTSNGEPAAVDILMPLLQQPNMQVREGEWSIPWTRSQNQQPLVLRWRAVVPAACIRH